MNSKSAATTLSKELELLLCVARPAIDETVCTAINQLSHSTIDWKMFFELALYHGMCPAVCERIDTTANSPIPDEFRSLLTEENFFIQRRSMVLLAELFRLQQTFLERKIPILFLNGPVMGFSAYDNFKLRSFRSLDLIVDKQLLSGAWGVLEDCGYKAALPEEMSRGLTARVRQPGYDVLANLLTEASFAGPNPIALANLHWNSAHYGVRESVNLFDYYHPLKVADKSITTVSREAHFVICCVSAAQASWSPLFRLVDIASWLKQHRTTCDWQKVYEISRDLQATKTVRASIQLAKELLNATPPEHGELGATFDSEEFAQLRDEVIEELSRLPVRWGVYKTVRKTWLLADSKNQAIGKILRDLMLPHRWPIVAMRLPPRLYFLHYLLNPIGILFLRAFHLLKRTIKAKTKMR